MEETRRLRNMVTRYSFIFAVGVELISLFFTKGFHAGFAYGLFLGTAIGAVNFTVLTFTIDKILARKGEKKLTSVSLLGFFIRMSFIGGGFILAVELGTLAWIACLSGLFMTRVSIYYIHFVKKSIF